MPHTRQRTPVLSNTGDSCFAFSGAAFVDALQGCTGEAVAWHGVCSFFQRANRASSFWTAPVVTTRELSVDPLVAYRIETHRLAIRSNRNVERCHRQDPKTSTRFTALRPKRNQRASVCFTWRLRSTESPARRPGGIPVGLAAGIVEIAGNGDHRPPSTRARRGRWARHRQPAAAECWQQSFGGIVCPVPVTRGRFTRNNCPGRLPGSCKEQRGLLSSASSQLPTRTAEIGESCCGVQAPGWRRAERVVNQQLPCSRL